MINDNDFASLWNDSPASEMVGGGNYDNLPDGKYSARINSVRFEMSKNGKQMIAWDFVITDNDKFTGRHVFHHQFVTSQKSIGYVKAQFAKLGLDVCSYEQMQAVFASILDAIVDITLKTSKATAEYEARQNVYINKIIEQSPSDNDSFIL